MKGSTAFLCMLMMLFLVAFSYLFSAAAAIPTTRSLKSFEKDPSLHDLLPQQDEVEMSSSNTSSEEELVVQVEEGGGYNYNYNYIEGRMDMESNDYPGTGANNHHDPKTPGKP